MEGKLVKDEAIQMLWSLAIQMAAQLQTKISVDELLTDGTKIASLKIGDQVVDLYCQTNTTYSDMVGATSSKAGGAGLVPAPPKGSNQKVLSGAGNFIDVSAGITDDDLRVVSDIFGISI